MKHMWKKEKKQYGLSKKLCFYYLCYHKAPFIIFLLTVLQVRAYMWISSRQCFSQDCPCDCACMCMCRALSGLCTFVWPCGRQDVAELCFCHDYAWWNKASGSQMESLCMGAFVAFPGPSTAETLTSSNTSFRRKNQLKIRYYLTVIIEWWVKSVVTIDFASMSLCIWNIPIKNGDRGFQQRLPCYDNRTKQQWWLCVGDNVNN